MYIYIYIRLITPLGVNQACEGCYRVWTPFCSPTPPPKNWNSGVCQILSDPPQGAQNVFFKLHLTRATFGQNLDSILVIFWLSFSIKNPSEIEIGIWSRFYMDSCSQSQWFRCLRELKILQNLWRVVQKSTLRISELRVKCHLHVIRIWVQNPSNFD